MRVSASDGHFLARTWDTRKRTETTVVWDEILGLRPDEAECHMDFVTGQITIRRRKGEPVRHQGFLPGRGRRGILPVEDASRESRRIQGTWPAPTDLLRYDIPGFHGRRSVHNPEPVRPLFHRGQGSEDLENRGGRT